MSPARFLCANPLTSGGVPADVANISYIMEETCGLASELSRGYCVSSQYLLESITQAEVSLNSRWDLFKGDHTKNGQIGSIDVK